MINKCKEFLMEIQNGSCRCYEAAVASVKFGDSFVKNRAEYSFKCDAQGCASYFNFCEKTPIHLVLETQIQFAFHFCSRKCLLDFLHA